MAQKSGHRRVDTKTQRIVSAGLFRFRTPRNFAMSHSSHNWGEPPWEIDFHPPKLRTLPKAVDFAIVGGGFAGLAAAAWLRLLAPEKSVAVLEAFAIGAGASGRTGGMALAETAAGDQPGLGDVLAGFKKIQKQLRVKCDLNLGGAWEIGRSGGLEHSPISWSDSGTLRVVKEVPGGTLDPGKLVSGLARAAHRRGAVIYEHHRVTNIAWGPIPELELEVVRPSGRPKTPSRTRTVRLRAGKILFATNALSLDLNGLANGTHARLTLAAITNPVKESLLREIGLDSRKPFYTVDFPYLWGRVRKDRSLIWGAGLVQSPDSEDLEAVDVTAEEPAAIFARLEDRVRHLHPALAGIEFTARWGGPILFRESSKPVFGWHPKSGAKAANGLVLGAFAGHGVALSSYFGAWAAEVLLGRRRPPKWGAIGARGEVES
jgi:glycine/D-amino acid oxidase-like deaminating enzyme